MLSHRFRIGILAVTLIQRTCELTMFIEEEEKYVSALNISKIFCFNQREYLGWKVARRGWQPVGEEINSRF